MKMSSLLITLLLFVGLQSHAGEGIAWGKPVNGLRIGISCQGLVVPSSERPTFKVYLENTSDTPLTIPSIFAYVPKKHERVADYFIRPLYPVMNPVSEEKATYSQTGGQPLETVSREQITLETKQVRSFDGVLLDEHCYAEGHDDYEGKTTVRRWWLLPDRANQVSFGFENETSPLQGKVVWTGNAVSAEVKLHVVKPSMESFKIKGQFELGKRSYFVGEPIYVTFSVINNGTKDISFQTGGDYRGRGRHDRFTFRAVDAQGREVEDPVPLSGIGGGLGGARTLTPGESYSEVLLLNVYCAFREPGEYTITGSRTLYLTPKDSRCRIEECMPAVEVKLASPLTLRRDSAAMQEYLLRLEKRLITGKTHEKAYQELRALAMSKSELALSLVKKLVLADGDYRPQAIIWLNNYPREQAENVLVRVAECKDPVARRSALGIIAQWKAPKYEALICSALTSDDKEERRAAVQLCYRYAPKSAFKVLLEMNKDADPVVRRYLSAALAEYGKQEAIPVLLELLHDPDPDHFIKIWAAGALGRLDCEDGIPVMIDLLKVGETQNYRGNIVLVLEELSGKQFGEYYSEWNLWWENEGKLRYLKQSNNRIKTDQ